MNPNSNINNYAPAGIKNLGLADSFLQKCDELKNEASKYKEIRKEIGTLNPAESKDLYDKLVSRFRKIEYEMDDNIAWVQRGDLIDLIEDLRKINSTLPEVSPGVRKEVPAWANETVPLVAFGNIKEVGKAFQNIKREEIKEAPQLQVHLRGLEGLKGEHTGTAKWVHKFTSISQPTPLHTIIFKICKKGFRALTRFLGFAENRSLKKNKAIKIAQFSRKMGIQSVEVVAKKDPVTKEVSYHYMGTEQLFGKSVHEFDSINQWFARDLTPAAREKYLARLRHDEKKLAEKYGTAPNEASREVIVNSFSRIRQTTIEPGKLEKAQELTGKVLNPEAEAKAKLGKDKPEYYQEKYSFSVKNLFGRKTEDLVKPELMGQGGVPIPDMLKLDDPMFRTAQHHLLGQMYRFLNRTGATQIIQRLAPADIHNYVAPLEGKPLTYTEAVEELEKYIEKQKEYIRTLNPPQPEQEAELISEMNQLKQLSEVFNQQKKLLNSESQVTIDIYGTNESVSTTAIRNQSSILSQNDRKIMMYKHNDGSFSFHVFIGATGVNRVNVVQSSSEKIAGQRQGDMQFGDEKAKSKLKMGEKLGTFPMNGSTVISFYLPHDFSLLPKMESFKKEAFYGKDKERAELEIKADMGAPILRKTEIMAAGVIEMAVPHLFIKDSKATPESILEEVMKPGYEIGKANSKQEREYDSNKQMLQRVKDLINKKSRSYEDERLLENIKRTLAGRLKVLNGRH